MKNHKKDKRTKESPFRSLSKAISWRIIASLTTFLISFVVFNDLETAGTITIVDFSAKLILYYFHERMWTNIDWGKSWRRAAWKRKYRAAHKNLARQ